MQKAFVNLKNKTTRFLSEFSRTSIKSSSKIDKEKDSVMEDDELGIFIASMKTPARLVSLAKQFAR